MKPRRPTRADIAGRTYLDLQNLARRTGRVTGELHQLYLLECFLDRLTRSAFAERFASKAACCWPPSTPAALLATST